MKRNDNVAKNKAKLKELGLVPSKSAKSCQKEKGKCKETNDDASESEYVPDNNDLEVEQQSDREDDNVTSKRTKKVKRQRVEIGAGPRTRLQATKLPSSSEKEEATAGATSLSVEVNNAPVLRDQEKQQIEKEIPRAESQTQHLQSQSDDAPVDATPKRKRGKTKMNHVHNRGEKKKGSPSIISSSPVADDGKLLSEFSNFLGTTVRQFVSLTCASWHQVPEKGLLLEYVQDEYIIPEDVVPWINKSMSDHFRSFKGRTKRDHYKPYSTDDERLAHRPEEVPLSDWRILLKYWGDEKVKEIAKRNQESQNKITETHTTGATSFAQIAHKLRLEKLEKLKNLKNLENTNVDGDAESDADCEELAKVYDVDVYVATRK
ncbi:hypothetical protein POM88_010046 [Heracleum sosnowskyi]|uniref:Transposase n=1 Tax=Heracleum sosnowskyi TaxID=360622 RepID=A0AAD8JBR1_9APIA|nr:hypothetical protein POM88_010046 [Heracleum sosnowskyi]